MSATQPLDLAPAAVRWPLQPLLDAVCLTRTALARRLGVGGHVVAEAADTGLSDTLADQWATRLGRHPADVWGWDWVTAGFSPQRINSLPVLERLTDHLRGQLDDGHLAPGDPIPTARAIAAEWRVSHNTATRAVRILRDEGRLTGGGPGRLVYVADRPVHDCATCGTRISPGTEHYPSGVGGQRRTVHPGCCPCTQGAGR